MVLYLNACVRKESRTNRLAAALLQKLGGTYEEVKLPEEMPGPLSEQQLQKRTKLTEQGNYTDPMFRLARQFAAAEVVVVAAPFWDLSFPAVLKQYFEQINAAGVTFRYTAEGIPQGLCRAKELYYVTTAGGPIFSNDYGFGYVKALAEGFYHIPKVSLIQAEGLDIEGADVEGILLQAEASIDRLLTNASETDE